MISPFRLLLLSCAICSAAEPVLDLRLNDPNSLIKGKVEGISALGPAFSGPTATIASGYGGRALPLIDTGTGTTAPSIRIFSDRTLGTFLQMKQGVGSSAKNIGLGILPGSGATSLSAIYKGNNVFDGGFDFFFRIQKDSQEGIPRIVFHSRCGPFEIGLKPSAKQDGFDVSFLNKEPILEATDIKLGSKPNLAGKIINPIPIEAGEIYHVAVLFQTANDGVVSIKVYLEKGVGEIHPENSPGLNASLDFKINKPAPESPVVGKATLVLGAQDFSQTLDVADFRIFAPAPGTFPGLATKN